MHPWNMLVFPGHRELSSKLFSSWPDGRRRILAPTSRRRLEPANDRRETVTRSASCDPAITMGRLGLADAALSGARESLGRKLQ